MLDLPVFNGASDGLFVIALLWFATAAVGKGLWLMEFDPLIFVLSPSLYSGVRKFVNVDLASWSSGFSTALSEEFAEWDGGFKLRTFVFIFFFIIAIYTIWRSVANVINAQKSKKADYDQMNNIRSSTRSSSISSSSPTAGSIFYVCSSPLLCVH